MLSFSALVALSFTFGDLVAEDISPAILTLLRFIIACIFMSVIAFYGLKDFSFLFKKTWRWLIIGALMGTFFITMFEALSITMPLATSAVFTLTPLIAAGLGRVLVGTKTGIGTFISLSIGAIGALWVIFGASLEKFLSLDIGRGEAIFLFGVICHAAVPAVTRRLVTDASPFQVAFGTVCGALIVTIIYALPEIPEADFTTLSPAIWGVAFYLGIFTTAGTFFLLQYAIPRLTPGKVMAYTYLIPSWVVLHSLIDGTHQPPLIYIGVALTLIALLLLLREDM